MLFVQYHTIKIDIPDLSTISIFDIWTKSLIMLRKV